MNYVLGFIFVGDDKILLQLKNRGNSYINGKWNGLGGKIEQGELAIKAMLREYIEETGDERPIKFGFCYELFYKNAVSLHIFKAHVPSDYYDGFVFMPDDPNPELLKVHLMKDIPWESCNNNLYHLIGLIE